MSINHILLSLLLGVSLIGCTNDLKFSKGKEGGSGVNPPGACPDSVLADFVAPPSLVELGQAISLNYEEGEVSWFIQKPDGTVAALTGNSASYTVAQLGRHSGRVEAVNTCGTIEVLSFVFDAFLPVGASSLIINRGEQYTSLAEVSLSLVSVGATEMYITESAGCNSGGQWEVYNTQKLRNLQGSNKDVTVYAKFKNPVGNASSCVSDSIVHDDIKPSLSISTAPSLYTNASVADFGLAASDSGSGVDTYFCSIDSGNVSVCSSVVNYTSLRDGVHVFSTRVSDKAGNLSDWVQHTWNVDTVKPTLRFTSTPSNPSSVSNAGFSFEGSDLGSGVDGYECKLDAGNFGACVSPTSVVVSDGSHTYSVRNKDKAGNVSDPISYTWVTDATAPVIVITAAPSNPTTAKEASFSFTVTDAGTGIRSINCALDSQAAVRCANKIDYANLDLGAHSFKVVATDAVGNSSQVTYSWSINRNVIDQPVIVPPGAGSSDILFVMDNTGSMYEEYRNQIDLQMRNFLSRLHMDYQIGVITGDHRNSSSDYAAGRLVPVENGSQRNEFILTPSSDRLDHKFINTLARREVTCVYGTWTGPNNRFCGTSGWNLPSGPQFVASTLMAFEEPNNQALFRNSAALNIVMVSDSNELCSSGMTDPNGVCLPADTRHSPEALVAAARAKWPEKDVKVHSLIWRDQDRCAFSGGSRKGANFEYLSNLTGGISRSICNVSRTEGEALADAINSATTYSVSLQCTPIDINNDGVVNASDVVVTYNPQPSQLPSLSLVGDKLTISPVPASGTNINLRYTCP